MKPLLHPGVRKFVAYFFSALLLVQLSACYYFNVRKLGAEDMPTLQELGTLNNFFFVHLQDEVYQLKDIQVDSTALTGTLIQPEIAFHYTPERRKKYKSGPEGNIVHEVHLYLNEGMMNLDTGFTSIPIDDLAEIHVINPDTGANIASFVLGTVGVIALIGAIVLLTKDSCPYVYADNGQDFIFEGEIFGGAIARNLAREDYLPLPALKPVDGNYRIRISNELKERQYTDFADLIVAHHPKGTQLLLDRQGRPHTIAKPESPVSVVTQDGGPISASFAATDRQVHLFNELDHDVNEVYLTFDRPENARLAKLLLNGKNTYWGDFIVGEFTKKFGARYNSWMEQRLSVPSEVRKQKLIDHHLPLSIYVRRGMDWILVEHLNTIGPLGSRDFVVPIDLEAIPGETVQIKLETGFMFWEVDFAAMDFSENQVDMIQVLHPDQVTSNDGKDWHKALTRADEIYMEQPAVGNMTQISYPAVTKGEDQAQSYFLHTRGYYEPIRDYEGEPQWSSLRKFRQAGYFATFSRESYRHFIKLDEAPLMVNNDRTSKN